MKRVLIVSPRFAPTSAADMQRVRQSLPHFAEHGWQPTVLAVKPEFVESCEEPQFLQTLPPDIDIVRVRALPAAVTRNVGVGDIALRSFPFLYRAGVKMLGSGEFALTYFSTTAFASIALGRLWKQRFGVPFVVDMQDPWLSDYYDDKPASARPPKYRFARTLHRALEPWTMRAVDGLVSVSPAYLTTLHDRYSWLIRKPQVVLPFGASSLDFEVIRKDRQPNPFFRRTAGRLNGVYVGRGGQDMQFALRIVFTAFKRGLQTRPELFDKIRLHFIGTDYATGKRVRTTVAPVAREVGVSEYVTESPERVPYFEALQLLDDADFLIVPGSDDAQYTASKIYPYILARKPMLAVFHARSSVCDVLRATGAGGLLSFDTASGAEPYAPAFLKMWLDVVNRLPFVPEVDWEAFAPYTAAETTRVQCELFDQVLSERSAASSLAVGPRLAITSRGHRCSS